MAIKKFLNKFRKLPKAQEIAGVQEIDLYSLYQEYVMSDTFAWYEVGERYYKGQNDILYRSMYKVVDGSKVLDTSQPNNKLNHCFMKTLVDQKVDYVLGKPVKLTCENEQYLNEVQQILQENDFDYILKRLGVQASNNGIAWLQCYIDDKGKFKFIPISAKQIIPLWADDLHTSLKAVIRVYNVKATNSLESNQLNTILEYWTDTGYRQFTIQGKTLANFSANTILGADDGNHVGEIPHYLVNGKPFSFGKVPFIPFKNNFDEFADVRYVKNLIDNYDLTRSDLGNALEQLRNFIIVLENAQGTDLEELLNNLKLYGVLKTQNVDGTGSKASMMSNPIECQASQEHSQTLKENIIELLQGVNMNLDFKAPPSGIALQLLYRGLDIKANGFEAEFRHAFKELQYFIAHALNVVNNDIIDIQFQRDLPTNTAEQIQNIKNSQGTISNETLWENHPMVKDVELEKKRFANENKDHEFKKIPYGF